MKKIFLLIIFLIFGNFVNAAFTSYSVPTEIPMGKNLVISGQLDQNGEIFCSFYLYQTDDGELLYQLTDEKTTTTGFISSSYFVVPGSNKSGEQILYQDKNYTAKTRCGNSEASSTFVVGEAIPITDKVAFSLIWFKDNFLAVVFGVAIIVVIVGFAYTIFLAKK